MTKHFFKIDWIAIILCICCTKQIRKQIYNPTWWDSYHASHPPWRVSPICMSFSWAIKTNVSSPWFAMPIMPISLIWSVSSPPITSRTYLVLSNHKFANPLHDAIESCALNLRLTACHILLPPSRPPQIDDRFAHMLNSTIYGQMDEILGVWNRLPEATKYKGFEVQLSTYEYLKGSFSRRSRTNVLGVLPL